MLLTYITQSSRSILQKYTYGNLCLSKASQNDTEMSRDSIIFSNQADQKIEAEVSCKYYQ